MNRSEGRGQSQQRERSALSPQPMGTLEPAWRQTREGAHPVVSTILVGGLVRPVWRVSCLPARPV